MDANIIMQAIGAVGFPIVACCGLFWMINKTIKELTVSINNNTEMLKEFRTYMERKDEKGN